MVEFFVVMVVDENPLIYYNAILLCKYELDSNPVLMVQLWVDIGFRVNFTGSTTSTLYIACGNFQTSISKADRGLA